MDGVLEQCAVEDAVSPCVHDEKMGQRASGILLEFIHGQ